MLPGNVTDVLEEITASIFRVVGKNIADRRFGLLCTEKGLTQPILPAYYCFDYHEDGGSNVFRNVRKKYKLGVITQKNVIFTKKL